MTDEERIRELEQRIEQVREHCDSQILQIRNEIQEMRTNATKLFVTQERFSPVEKIVIGAVTLVLIAFATALIAGVFK